MTGVLFLLIAWVTPMGPLLAARLILVVILIALFGIDLHHQILPNVITLPGIVIGFLFSLVGPPGLVRQPARHPARCRHPLCDCRRLLPRCAARKGSGMGDVKMLAMIGAFLGWKAVLVTLILSSFSGALVGIGLIALLARQHAAGAAVRYVPVAGRARGDAGGRAAGHVVLAASSFPDRAFNRIQPWAA